MSQLFTRFPNYPSSLANFTGLVVLSFMTACGSNAPDPAVSFLGGYVGQAMVQGSTTSLQTYPNLTVHIIKANNPDSVMIDLLHRAKLFPNPLLATVQPNKLTIHPQPSPVSSHTLTGQATRTGDSLHLTLIETGGVSPIRYEIKASRLLD
jgi:hypothetical protein